MAVLHRSRQWIASLLGDWEDIAASDIQVVTMNGNEASGISVARQTALGGMNVAVYLRRGKQTEMFFGDAAT